MMGIPSGRLPSTLKHDFSQVPRAEIPRSQFNRSHGGKTTFDAGYLVPVFLDEVLPGDTFNLRMSMFARLSTPIVPVMDNMYCDSFFFFVPNRLIWDNWEKFNGQQTNPGDSTDFLIPQVTWSVGTQIAIGSLFDYFGLPAGANFGTNGLSVSTLWNRAYNLIYNEWFRDQNLQNSVVVDKDDGPDAPSDYVLLRRGKRHDYFTSCLPWPQKGPAVNLPLGTSAPITGLGKSNQTYSGGGATVYETDGTGSSTFPAGFQHIGDASADNGFIVQEDPNNAGFPNIRADLTNATASTINALRQAFQLQRLYERDARGGTRYTEIIRAHFGVTSPDARLQRPEYLGGGSTPISISPIPQTSSTDTTTPQGNLAAMGTMSAAGHGFVKSFTEHGVVLGLVSVRADLTYQRCVNRMFSRSTRFDFYWPALSHIGEQAVLSKEIYGDGGIHDTDVFGYQERYAEYRYKPSQITGKFRSYISGGSLDVWHLAQDFQFRPVLDSSFIVENPPVARVVATGTAEPQFLLDTYFDFKCARPMPVYSVPGLIDHF